jgi:peptidyl-prolyl cis-trans isomerase A (cyclophilin A)
VTRGVLRAARATAALTALTALAAACAGRTPGAAASNTASNTASGTASGAAPTRVRIDTDSGAITVEVYADRAPVTAANFLRYVSEGRYDGGAFYRAVTMRNQPTNAVKIEVIQGGLDADSAKRLPPIAHETTAMTGLRHTDGAISMARGAPGSASSEFFICIGDQPELDMGGRRNPDGQGFAAFGRVVDGMDVARRIQRMPADSVPPQRMPTVVRIRSVALVR